MVRKVLFATDFSALSKTTLTYVSRLARKMNARVICAHSVTLPGPVYSRFQEAETRFEELEKELRVRLEQFCLNPSFRGLHVEPRLTLGLPEQTVNHIAAVENVDLLVVGKNSKSPVQRFFLGSATEKIVREASCPVLVVPDVGKRSLKWSPLICSVDFSNNSIEALNLAARLAVDYDLQLTAVHVVEMDPSHFLKDPAFKRYILSTMEEAERRLQGLLQTTGAPQGSDVVVDKGKPSVKIVELAKKLGSDLVIVGVRGLHMHRGRGTGSTASAVMREAAFPVLLMPC